MEVKEITRDESIQSFNAINDILCQTPGLTTVVRNEQGQTVGSRLISANEWQQHLAIMRGRIQQVDPEAAPEGQSNEPTEKPRERKKPAKH